MAKLVYGLNVSLDGYADHDKFGGAPATLLFRHFIEQVRGLSGMVYGRGMYEVMRYWDEDMADWGPDERDFAQVWRSKHKWLASHSLTSVGPNATLMSGDIAAAVRDLKARLDGEIEVAGPALAHSLADLVDEYRMYMRPFVVGSGKKFFAGPRPPLRLVASERVGEDAVRLTYVPA
jgi:dihydrofolate reductase